MSEFKQTVIKRISPLAVVESILAVTLLIYGVYCSGPWYTPADFTALALVFGISPVRYIIGIAYVVAGGVLFHAVFIQPEILRAALFATFCAFVSITAINLFIVGVFPFWWLFTLALALIAGVYYLADGDKRAD